MVTKVAVLAASGPHDTPGLDTAAPGLEFQFADNSQSAREVLADAEVVFSWDYRGRLLADAWPDATSLGWVHQAGAGVDAVLFPNLIDSEVVLTNSAGVFDQAIAEFVLSLILAFAKHLPASLRLQSSRQWEHRLNERVAGRSAVVVGVGGIGRATCSLLRNAGLTVFPVGRSSRDDPDLGRIESADDLLGLVPNADFLVAAAPLTRETFHMFDASVFAAMPASGRFINVGRGDLADEGALIRALADGHIAGAGLDVFATEPLPPGSLLWSMDNVIVTPHHAGDYIDHREDLVKLFRDNLARWRDGEPLKNVVDKRLGFVALS